MRFSSADFLRSFVLFVFSIAISVLLVPGIAVTNAHEAFQLFVVFGLVLAVLPYAMKYLNIPVNKFTLIIFYLLVNEILIFWSLAVLPGIVFASFAAAFCFAIVLACMHVYMPIYISRLAKKLAANSYTVFQVAWLVQQQRLIAKQFIYSIFNLTMRRIANYRQHLQQKIFGISVIEKTSSMREA